MNESTLVLEYRCPCCDAGLLFSGQAQKLKCEYCENTFDIDTIRAYNESQGQHSEEIIWEDPVQQKWCEDDQNNVQAFQCPSCGGEIVTDATTAATFCPFCDSPTIMPSRLDGYLKPDAVIPFQKTKEDAKKAFSNLCKGKPLLPRSFISQYHIDKITGIYVPFWLYDCDVDYGVNYKATRIHRWSDSRYHYTKTDHFLLRRGATASFERIPMDGSSKMEDSFMESIEPYAYDQLVTFDMAYLTGYFADKYDIPSENGKERICQRAEQSIQEEIQRSTLGYSTAIPTTRNLQIQHGKASYVLLPVWMLNTKYNGKIYTFAMNGQTGKMAGTFPICPKRSAMWFAGIFAGVTLLTTVAQLIF